MLFTWIRKEERESANKYKETMTFPLGKELINGIIHQRQDCGEETASYWSKFCFAHIRPHHIHRPYRMPLMV